jgi:hypothetical protein
MKTHWGELFLAFLITLLLPAFLWFLHYVFELIGLI